MGGHCVVGGCVGSGFVFPAACAGLLCEVRLFKLICHLILISLD